jgi:hypothetical protein
VDRARLLADAALVFADAGVPVWTDGIPESAGALGVLGTEYGLDPDTGALTHEGSRTVLTIAPGALGVLPVRAKVYARPDGAAGDAVLYRVVEGPRPQPPDGVLHEVVVSEPGEVG